MSHRKKLVVSLLTLLIVFVLIFVFAFIAQLQERALLSFGMAARTENLIVMGFSVLSMINVVYELSQA